MLKINLLLAIRNIFRNKLYTIINIIGLGVASAFCILVYLYVKDEQSFDRFHKSQDRLFRVEQTDLFSSFRHENTQKGFFSFLMKDDERKNMTQTPVAFAPDLKRTFPEIENAVRIQSLGDPVIRVANQSFKEIDNAAYVDKDFFQVFNFPLIKGNPATVLSGQNTVVISERLAKKYFGETDPVGKVINIVNSKLLLTVSGVAKDFPTNSSLRYYILVPREADPYYADEIKQGTNSFSDLLILKLQKGVNVSGFQKKLDDFSVNYFKPVVESMAKGHPENKPHDFHVFLRPFGNAHYNQSQGWGHYTDLKNIYQLICLTFIILLIASVNYILLTLTNAASHSQDVGIRKTIGASKLQVVFQYYTETQLLAIISVISGLVLAIAFLPFFNNLTGTAFSLASFSFGEIFFALLILAILLGLIAGIYPALAMSNLKPINIMRSFSTFRLNPTLSKGLVIVQFAICVVLIISSLVIYKQMQFVNKTNMGFDKDQVVVIQNPYGFEDKVSTNLLKDRLYHYVAISPYLEDMTTTWFNFGGYNQSGHMINGVRVPIQVFNVDYNYFSFNKIPIILGRTFSHDIASDTARIVIPKDQLIAQNSTSGHNVVINETLYKMLKKPEFGQFNRELGGVIIGVCKDYHTDDLTKKIMPAYHQLDTRYTGYYWIRIKQYQNIANVIDTIRVNWNKLSDHAPFSYTFMNEDVAKKYDSYRRWMSTMAVSCFLAILIACMGLFGLSGLATLNRTKEIGIRKVLGATVSNLFIMLNRGTFLLAIVAFITAVPIAYYLQHQWLENFAYHIKPGWMLFGLAGGIAILTALIAVSFHTIRAATANPVKSLRNE
jgi:putative ABC transport system permease protein